ncbi:S-layer homology domain-containing protein [Paenibacillus sp. NFR01]|uniref:S-layer homology domain-containing protein n=1 Tax=Paenibacillus sp. NFR01 TaxID=1566279 RepID=UPI0008C117FD|nr:S-layer homology domain-containing protein [Paenibacillus sp. NFR01]SEU00809.1 S-layer homology domain-containing protein [Paenibacillus sp. NFR01]
MFKSLRMIQTAFVLLLAFMLSWTGGVPPIAAAESAGPAVKLTIGDVSLSTGSISTVPVKVTAVQGIYSYNLQLNFDPARLEVSGLSSVYGNTDKDAGLADPKGYFSSNIDNKEGWLRVAWIDTSAGGETEHPILGDRELFVIHVKAKGATGDTGFTLASGDPEQLLFAGVNFGADAAAEALQTAVTGGAVTVIPARSDDSGKLPSLSDVKVYLGGKEQPSYASASSDAVNGRTVTTIKVDNDKALAQIGQQGQTRLTLALNSSLADKVVGKLNGTLVKAMESGKAEVEVKTPFASYVLPAPMIQIDEVAKKLGAENALSAITIDISLNEADADAAAAAQKAAQMQTASLVSAPVEFKVSAEYNGHQVAIDRFNNYVERSIAIPEGTDPGRITTAVVMGEDGSLKHIPTRVVQGSDGSYSAVVNSMSNSVYAVIYSAKSFADTEKHWSRADVADLASRLVIQGASANRFEPDRSISRAEFVTVLLRGLGLYGSTQSTASLPTDVSASAWYAGGVQTAESRGLIGGYADGSFKPGASISRAEAMVVLNRAAALLGQSRTPADPQAVLSAFGDAGKVGAWAKEAVAAAVGQGWIKGSGGELKPGATLTRAEAAAMIRRLLIQADLINS